MALVKDETWVIACGTGVPVATTGGNQSIDIRQPYLALNWLFAVKGICPPRN